MADDSCVLCHEHQESEEHIFGRYRKSLEVRIAVNKWWNLLPSTDAGLEDFFVDVDNSHLQPNKNLFKAIVSQAYVWAIWKGRNEALFNDHVFNSFLVANVIQANAYQWCRDRSPFGRGYSWVNWCCNPDNL